MRMWQNVMAFEPDTLVTCTRVHAVLIRPNSVVKVLTEPRAEAPSEGSLRPNSRKDFWFFKLVVLRCMYVASNDRLLWHLETAQEFIGFFSNSKGYLNILI